MRRRTAAVIGVGAVASAAALTIGLLPGTPGESPAVAAELTPFQSCTELRDWYVDAALPFVTAWGFGGPILALDNVGGAPRVEADAYSSSPDDAVGSSGTGTNVQEAGVDEPDVAKTDGRLVAHVADGAVLLSEVVGREVRRLAEIPLPEGIDSVELLLTGDRLVLLATRFEIVPLAEDVVEPWASGADRIAPYDPGRPKTRVLVVDVADPTSPRTVSDTTYDGTLLSARQYDRTVRLALSTTQPQLDFVQPGGPRTPAAALRENRRILRTSSVEDWLPTVDGGTLLDCGDVHHPRRPSGFGTISVVTFDTATPDTRDATAVTASGQLVYSSTDRFYVATNDHGWWGGPLPVDAARGEARVAPREPRTEIHAFALDGTSTEYVASGSVKGWVRDRWSFDEHEGRLRLARAIGRFAWEARENGITVLEERGDELVPVGNVDGMGIDEQIQSVRWFDDLAVMVTFRQIDPLYTVDLSDPTDPEVRGELKIPGFSSYLHPIGGDLLLGLGQDADLDGRQRGAQAAVFDLRDVTDPERVDTAQLGQHTEFATAWDSRAFTYLPGPRVAIAPVVDNWTGTTRLAFLEVDERGEMAWTLTNRVAGARSYVPVRTLPIDETTVIVVAGDEVTLRGF